MNQAIMYNPEAQDNFYYIIGQANMMQADLTEVRKHMETATFAFYIVATKDEQTGITTLESWYRDTFCRTWKFTTAEEHLHFNEIERI